MSFSIASGWKPAQWRRLRPAAHAGAAADGEARHKVPKPHGKVLLLSEFFMCAGAQHNVIDNLVRQDAAPGSREAGAWRRRWRRRHGRWGW